MPDNRCVTCQESPCACGDINNTIRQVAESNATGYVATPHGPMNADACRVLAMLDDPTGPASPIVLWRSEWFQVGRRASDGLYLLGAILEGGETSPWRTRDGKHDVACHLEDLTELHALLGRIIGGEAGEPFPPANKNPPAQQPNQIENGET